MLALIFAIILHIQLALAPALYGHGQEVLITAFPILAAVTVVPGLALIGSSVSRPTGITLVVFRSAIYIFTAVAAALGPQLLVTQVCRNCLSSEQLLSGQAADIKDGQAALEDARSTAADTIARLAQNEDAFAGSKGSLDTVHVHTEIAVAELKARLTASEAEVLAVGQDAAEAKAKVETSESMATAAQQDLHLSETIRAENDDRLKESEEALDNLRAEVAEMMEPLDPDIEHLESVVADEKIRAESEQDAANLAGWKVTEYEAKVECLEATAGMNAWELEQKDKMLESCDKQIAELKREQEARLVAAELKARNTDRINLIAQINRVDTALSTRRKEIEGLAAAIKSRSTAQATSGACQTSSPSAAQPSEELTAAGKVRDTRVRSPFAREHYAQLDVAMEAKDRNIVAARQETALPKKALKTKATATTSSSIPVVHYTATRTQPVSVKAGKENMLYRVVATSPRSSSRLPRPSPSPKMVPQLPRSSIPRLTRPPLARLPP